jgi:hypothetical protein
MKIPLYLFGDVSIPFPKYFMSLGDIFTHQIRGHANYLLGQRSEKGWWYYFPVVFAVKTPIALLLLLALGALATLKHLARARRDQLSFRWFIPAVPALAYFVISMLAQINIGVRHILPVYVFLYPLLAALLWRFGPSLLKKTFPAVAAGALCLLVAEWALIHPHYTAFFNALCGGPSAGPAYLVDSNIDWGQDLKKLKSYYELRQISSPCLAYFGKSMPEYYGIRARSLPPSGDSKEWQNLDCVAAVSATYLMGVYTSPDRFERLRRLPPMDRVGYSIYIFDLRKSNGPVLAKP